MKRTVQEIMVNCLVMVSFVAYAAQEPISQNPAERARQERNAVHSAQELVEQSSGKLGLVEGGEAVYLSAAGLFDFQRQMEEEIVGDLAQEQEQEIKAKEDLALAKIAALRAQLEAERKDEQEILAQLKIEQDKFDAEMKELLCKHGEAQHAKMAEFIFGGLGHGQDRDWHPHGLAHEGAHENDRPEVSGSEDEGEDWDGHFLAASFVDTRQAGDL